MNLVRNKKKKLQKYKTYRSLNGTRECQKLRNTNSSRQASTILIIKHSTKKLKLKYTRVKHEQEISKISPLSIQFMAETVKRTL